MKTAAYYAKSHEKAYRQLAGYMDTLGVSEGWLVVADDDLTKPWEKKIATETFDWRTKAYANIMARFLCIAQTDRKCCARMSFPPDRNVINYPQSQSKEEKMDLMTQYSEVVIDALRAIVKDERANILKAADLLSDETNKGKLLHVYGAGGHSSIAAMEIFWRAGGLANVNGMFPVGTNVMTAGPTTAKLEGYAHYIFNFYDVNPGDVLILVNFYGLNITAVDMALEAKKRGIRPIWTPGLRPSIPTTSRSSSTRRRGCRSSLTGS